MGNIDNIVVGGYYQTPEGRIALTFGVDNVKEEVSYHFDGEEATVVNFGEFCKWVARPDLNDFPNAKNPKLPYAFDLHFDIKHKSELKGFREHLEKEISHAKGELDLFDELVKHWGIKICD